MKRARLLLFIFVSGCLDFPLAEAQFCALRPDICGDGGVLPVDAGRGDAGSVDAGRDAGTIDAGLVDAGVDAGEPDAGSLDDAGTDAGELDAGFDAGEPFDAGFDAGIDAGFDAGMPPAVCGNTATEPPEVCDDGNTMPGDGCDPTCRYFNRYALLSGYPGAANYADNTNGLGARFAYITGLATDGTSVFVADQTSRAVREIDIATGATSTMFGGPSLDPLPDGGNLRAPVDVEYHTLSNGSVGAMYIADGLRDAGRVLRVDLTDPPGFRTVRVYRSDAEGIRAVAAGYNGAAEQIVSFTNFGLQMSRVLAGGGFGSDGTIAQTDDLEMLAGGPCSDITFIGGPRTADGGYASSNYVVTCDRMLIRVSSTGSVPSMLAGSTTAGCVDATAGAARLTEAQRLTWEGGNTAVFVDRQCERVRRVNLTTGAVTPVAGVSSSNPDLDGPNAQAIFSSFTGVAATGGIIYTSENGRVRRVDSTTTRTFAGRPPRPNQVFGRDAGYIGSGGIAVDSQYAWSVVHFQQQVLRTSLSTGEATLVANITNEPGGNFPGPMVRLGSHLYIGYENGRVRRIDLNRLPTDGGVPAAGALDEAFAMAPAEIFALATDGTTLWATTAQNRIVRVTSDGGVVPVAGALNGMTVTDGVGNAAVLGGPYGLTYANGSLWFLDGPPVTNRGTVLRRFDIDGGMVSTVLGLSGSAARIDGPGASPGDAGPARLAGGQALTANGTSLLIADIGQVDVLSGETDGPTLRLYDFATGQLSTAVGRPGHASFWPGTGRNAVVSRPIQLGWDSVRRRFVIFDTYELVFTTFE